MIQKMKKQGLFFGMALSIITLSSGNVFEVKADSIHSEIEVVENELKDLEAHLENYEKGTETAFGENIPNTYSLDAGDFVDEGL